MKLFKKLSAAAGACAVALSCSPAMATGTFSEHEELYNQLTSQGIKIVLNDRKFCTPDDDMTPSGGYSIYRGILHVCQDNGRPGGPQVAWTANDLDTLRHEAQHVIQDCIDGGLGDGELGPLLSSEEEIIEFALGILGEDHVKHIIKIYAEGGADKEMIYLELEAWAVAAHINPVAISNKLDQQCSVYRF